MPCIAARVAGGTARLDPANVEFARAVAEHSFVLLKNEDSGGSPPLPLSRDVRTIALIGPLADSASDMLGPWRARGDAADVVTLRTALTSRLQQSGGKVIYAKGTEILTAEANLFAEAVAAAKQADVVIMALGEDALWMSAEAASRAHLGLPGNQQQLLEAVAAAGKTGVLIVFSGPAPILTLGLRPVPSI